MSADLSHGLEELAGLIHFRVGAWHDFGYETPPAPNCKAIPPLGERTAQAIKAAHTAMEEIDELIKRLHMLRARLVAELRQDSDIRGQRTDRMLADFRARQPPDISPDPAAPDDMQETAQLLDRLAPLAEVADLLKRHDPITELRDLFDRIDPDGDL